MRRVAVFLVTDRQLVFGHEWSALPSNKVREEDMDHIRNPLEWGSDKLRLGALGIESAIRAVHRPDADLRAELPAVHRIEMADLKESLAKGFQDFATYRTDVLFLCVIYPIIGLVIARVVIGEGMFPLLFPLASGFALVGPFVAIGLYEMSRQREQGVTVNWATAFHVLRSPSSGAIAILGLLLMVIFVLWLLVAQALYNLTLGPQMAGSIPAFVHDVFATRRGWVLIVSGMSVGFVFAALVFAITIVSFPLLLDRQDVGLDAAIRTSIRAVIANPWTMTVWGLIIAASLAIGSIPFFLGLVIVIPVLGHTTWHLYRKLVGR
jgi:uncharacterized membrane protein